MTVLFVCVHNAGRSQMAEAILRQRALEAGVDVTSCSAGTTGAGSLNPVAVEATLELGIDMSHHIPKQLTPDLVAGADKIISMGCGVDADQCPAKFLVTDDWGLDDPAGQPIEVVRAIRDQIDARCRALVAEIREATLTVN